MKKIFLYIKYYFELKEKELSKEAYHAVKYYYSSRPVRNAKNPHPSVTHYQRRLEDTLAFQRAYKDKKRHLYAMEKLNQLSL
jgi:hypothetical protein